MRVVPLLGALAVLAVVVVPVHASSLSNTRVTRDQVAGSYSRFDGTQDATTIGCSTSQRPQNEPTIAVDPRDTRVVTAGANDYCTQATLPNHEVWAGYYRSTDGGTTFGDSLVPGYPADTTSAGVASPVHGICGAAGDPTQSFDSEGRLFYGFICFNRTGPVNGGVFVATYDQDGAHYVRTTEVAEGTPSGRFSAGLFQDKPTLVADQTIGPFSGNVYMAWSRDSGISNNNIILFSRSTDHGATFSTPIRVSNGIVGNELFTAMAVAPDGTLYLTFRTTTVQGPTFDGVWITRSTDGGATFSEPQVLARIRAFDSNQFSGNGGADCGDGPFVCPTGLTFSRFASLSAVAADSTGVHVVWSAELASGQAKIFVANSDDGVHFGSPATLDTLARGYQYFPDVASADGVITVVFYDSRNDPAYRPSLPPGDNSTGSNSGGAVDTFVAKSSDGGASWTESRVSTVSSNYNWETHGSRQLPFWGDYIYISAVPGAVNVAWTDSRNLVAGTDPRDPAATDGFDVFQPCPTNATIDNPCLNEGGLDQNIYSSRV
jgi:hypothetical protein